MTLGDGSNHQVSTSSSAESASLGPPHLAPTPTRPSFATIQSSIHHAEVTWFCADRGFGWLRADDGRELYVSQRQIRTEGFRCLHAGQHVTIIVGTDVHGPVACDVIPVLPSTAAMAS